MKLLVVTGDKRQEYLCEKLKNLDVECEWFDESFFDGRIGEFSVIVLPVPLSRDGENLFSDNRNFKVKINDFFNLVNKKQYFVGFGIPEKYKNHLKSIGVTFTDLMENADFVEYNSLLTAQGIIRVMLENTEQCVFDKKALVTGFGFVSKALCEKLNGLGLDVSVCARKTKALSEAENKGYKSFDFEILPEKINEFDFIFGTVPAHVVGENSVKSIKASAIYFELASVPFGADKLHFNKHNKKYVFAGGLPGKYCPEAWAQTVADYLCKEVLL